MADRETTRDRLTRIAIEHDWRVTYSDRSFLLLTRSPPLVRVEFTPTGGISYAEHQDEPDAPWQWVSGPDRRAQVEAWLTAPKGSES